MTPAAAQPAPTLLPPPMAPAPAVPPAIPRLTTRGPALDLAGAKVYVYDFLDFQEDRFSLRVLGEFDRQLSAWLAARARGVTLLRAQQTPFMREPDDGTVSEWSVKVTPFGISQRVPVMEMVASNHAAEAASGADHVLIAFPASFTTTGYFRDYSIRWVLIRKSDGKAWEHTYSGSHMVMWSDDERPGSRAKKFIDALEQAMTAAGILPPPAAP